MLSDTSMLTREEAAELAGVSVKFLHDCARRKRGPAFYRFSNATVLYRRDELEAWIRACHVTPQHHQ
jgi:Helix-turn-helix domain